MRIQNGKVSVSFSAIARESHSVLPSTVEAGRAGALVVLVVVPYEEWVTGKYVVMDFTARSTNKCNSLSEICILHFANKNCPYLCSHTKETGKKRYAACCF